jgi:hypothetical protein
MENGELNYIWVLLGKPKGNKPLGRHIHRWGIILK